MFSSIFLLSSQMSQALVQPLSQLGSVTKKILAQKEFHNISMDGLVGNSYFSLPYAQVMLLHGTKRMSWLKDQLRLAVMRISTSCQKPTDLDWLCLLPLGPFILLVLYSAFFAPDERPSLQQCSAPAHLTVCLYPGLIESPLGLDFCQMGRPGVKKLQQCALNGKHIHSRVYVYLPK